MIVEAAVFGRERRLDQIVRKVFQRNRVVVFDATASDRIAVSAEKGDGEIRLLQPILIRGFAECRDREREQKHQSTEAHGGGFRERFDKDPALPAPYIKAVHKG